MNPLNSFETISAEIPAEIAPQIAPQIDQGRWIIVADTLDSHPVTVQPRLARWLDLLILAGRYKRSMAAIVAGTTVLSLAIGFAIPNHYTASTELLPPQPNPSSVSAMLGQFGELASLAGKDVGKNPSALFVRLLESRTVADSLAARFDLMHIYGTGRLSQCRQRLAALTQIETTKEGVITISVNDRDPARAAEMANAYVSELIAMNQKLTLGEAARRRVFFEKQVGAARLQLSSAEDAMKQTQESTGMIQLDGQAKAFIESISSLRARIAIQQVQVEQMQTFATEQNPDLVRKQEELASLRGEFRQLQQTGFSVGVETPSAKLPAAGLEYVRRLRELKYSETLFELLSKQLEAARIDEAKNATAIQVIDAAEIPDRKSGPNRLLIVCLGFATGCAASLLWILTQDVITRANADPESRERWDRLKNSLWRFA